MERSRRWRVCKRTGAVLSALLLLAWAASLRWPLIFVKQENVQRCRFIGCAVGEFGFVSMPVEGMFPVSSDWTRVRIPVEPESRNYGFVLPVVQYESDIVVTIPLWVPLALALVPTAVMYLLDRRRQAPGLCRRCQYDLRGLTSPRCPECGTDIPAEAGVA